MHKLVANKDHAVPTLEAVSEDRKLRKIATQGVVKLFNAITRCQPKLEEAVQKEEKEKKHFSKNQFLAALKQQGTAEETPEKDDLFETAKKPKQKDAAPKDPKKWDALEDDFATKSGALDESDGDDDDIDDSGFGDVDE